MSNLITTGSFPAHYVLGVKKFYGEIVASHRKEYLDLYMSEKSTKAYEKYVEEGNFGLTPKKNEGDALKYGGVKQGLTTNITNASYALGFIITNEATEDDQYEGTLKRHVKSIVRSSLVTREIVCAEPFNRGYDALYPLSDGQPFFSASHPDQAGGVYSNIITPADMSEASLQDMITVVDRMKDNAGNPRAAKPVSLHVPPELRFEAARLLKSSLQAATPNNAINVINNEDLIPKGYFVNHFFLDTDAFFIKTDIEGAVYQDRTPDQMKFTEDFDTYSDKYRMYSRYAAGIYDARCFVGSAGTSA